jgi:predicted metalloprotease
MTRNQKILLGCGGAGCLGLIVVVIVCVVLVAAGYLSLPGSSNSNYNYNSNSNSNYNSNANTNSNANSNSDSSSSSSSMSDDDKHKLFQAAGITRDNPLILRVLRKIGFPNGTGEGYADFVKGHGPWALKNLEFIQSVSTPETGRAYVEAHIDD